MRDLDLDLLLQNLLMSPLYLVSFVTPRQKKVAFGSGQHDFNGNAKYLFLHVCEHAPDIRAAWIAPTRAVRDQVRARGLRAYWRHEPAGLWWALTSKLWVFNNRPNDIHFFASGRARTLNLWHGVGLKGLGFNSTSPKSRRDFNPKSLYRRLVRPWLYARPTWFGSTAPLMSEHFATAFRIPKERCLEVGYTRSDHFFLDRPALMRHLERTEPDDVVAFARSLERYDKVILYMPTYRDSREDFLASSGIDYERLDAAMRAQNALFIFKLHPWTRAALPDPARFANLRFAPKASDVYPYLPLAHLLVTDYSSVYFDFLLLDRPVVLFAFDEERYKANERDLILDFDTYMPGPRARTFDALLEQLAAPPPALTPAQREVRTLFWGGYAGRAAHALTDKIREILDT
ncbi:MAG: CDP-glycerol glycerophosphotransferase family protein [Deltaproteobacteria bacterium]|nr:CDP-glycerol glycerophosphotransferase family protein [Deltaproteobacteria bacterium]